MKLEPEVRLPAETQMAGVRLLLSWAAVKGENRNEYSLKFYFLSLIPHWVLTV